MMRRKEVAPGRMKRMLADQRIRFLAVGFANTAFATLLFAVLLRVLGPGVPAVVSLCIASAASLLTGFLAHRYLVFRVEGQFWLDLVRFTSVNYTALALNIAIMAILADGLGANPIAVQGGVIFFTVVFNYFGHKFISFRRRR